MEKEEEKVKKRMKTFCSCSLFFSAVNWVFGDAFILHEKEIDDEQNTRKILS